MKKALHAFLTVFPFFGLLAPGSLFGWQSVETGVLGQGRIGAVAATSQDEFLIATAESLIRLSAEGKVLSRTPWQPSIDTSSSILDMAAGAQGEIIIALGGEDGTLRTQMIGRAPAVVVPSNGRKSDWKARLIATSPGWLLIALDTDKDELRAWTLDRAGMRVSEGKPALLGRVRQMFAARRSVGAVVAVYAYLKKGETILKDGIRKILETEKAGIFTVPLKPDGSRAGDPLSISGADFSDEKLLAIGGSQPYLLCREAQGKGGTSWVCDALDDRGAPQPGPFTISSRDPEGVTWGEPAIVPYGDDWLAAFTVTGLRQKSFKPLGGGRIHQSESDIELAVLRREGKGMRHLKSLRKKHGDPIYAAVGKRHALFVWNQGGSSDSNNEYCIVELPGPKGR